MLPDHTQSTPAAASDFAPHQSTACADTELMRQADERRAAYYANVRRNIILAAGEWQA